MKAYSRVTVWILSIITLLSLAACQPEPTAESAVSEDDVARAVEATLTAQAENAPAAAMQAPTTQAPLTQASPTPTPNPIKVVPFAAIKSRLDFFGHEVESGWLYLYVFLAIENVSSEYQHFEMEYYHPQLVTKEGYSYPVERGHLSTANLIPPGFRVWGHGRGDGYNCLMFKVGENTTGYELHLPGFAPISLQDVPTDMQRTDLQHLFSIPSSQRIDIGFPAGVQDAIQGTASLNLAELFPTSPSAPRALEKGDVLPVGAEGEMTVVSSARQSGDGFTDLLTVTILYRNNSGGYGLTFPLYYYVIGDDGHLRSQESWYSEPEVGPGQEEQIEKKFRVGPDTKKLKLIVLKGVNTGGVGVFSLD